VRNVVCVAFPRSEHSDTRGIDHAPINRRRPVLRGHLLPCAEPCASADDGGGVGGAKRHTVHLDPDSVRFAAVHRPKRDLVE
jgi:hypothetical protein